MRNTRRVVVISNGGHLAMLISARTNARFMMSVTQRCLLLVAGLPGVGKTTLCGRLEEELRSRDPAIEVVRVTFDAVEADLRAGTTEWDVEAWRSARVAAFAACQRALCAPLDSRAFRRLVLVDDNFYYRSMRKPFFQMARRSELKVQRTGSRWRAMPAPRQSASHRHCCFPVAAALQMAPRMQSHS